MTLALTSVIAYGVQAEEPLNKYYRQFLQLEFTAAATDLTLDFGAVAGTFWTAVGATDPGLTALAALKDIASRAKGGNAYCLSSPQLVDRVQVLTLAAVSQYKIVADPLGPSLSVFTADGKTSWLVTIEWVLKPQAEPVYVVKTT